MKNQEPGIKEQAIHKAILLLKAGGAHYHIISDDGVEYGAPPKKKITRIHGKGPSNKEHIVGELRDMQVGDVRVIAPQPGDTAQRLQSNVAAHAGQKWGNGSYMTTVRNGSVEILRTA